MPDLEKIEVARRLCEAGRFTDALPLLRDLIRESKDSLQVTGYLMDEATCYANCGNIHAAENSVLRAQRLVSSDDLASAQVNLFWATLLIEHGRREEGVEILSRMIAANAVWLRTEGGRETYERIQVQRGFALIHLSRQAEARPVLSEAASFQSIDDETRSSIHCHLGRLQHEAANYEAAKKHFLTAQNLGVPADWEGIFHYYFGYTLYEIGEFQSAQRQLILSLQSQPDALPVSYKYKMLAMVSRKLGENDKAREYDKMARLS